MDDRLILKNNLKEIRIPKGSHTKFEKLLPFSVDKFVEV